jgi:adenylate cyclase
LKTNSRSFFVWALLVVCAATWLFLAHAGVLGSLEQNALATFGNEAKPAESIVKEPGTQLAQVSNELHALGLLGVVGLTALFTLPIYGLSILRRRGRVCLGLAIGFLLLLYALLLSQIEARLGLALPLFVPIGSVLSATAFIFLFRLNQEEKKRRRLQSIFGAYLSPALVDELVKSEDDPQSGGSEVHISILFSDIENFAGIAQELPPDRLVALMGIYLNAMTEELQASKATLDKFVGDGIVAMFGMPVVLPDHAAMACRAALRMQERCASLRWEWQASGLWPASVSSLHQRIGVHTGLAVVGNLGSKNRFNYTMIGDSVNLASRCEAIAKQYGVYTLVSGETLESACEELSDLVFRKVDDVIFKGRYAPVALYELWDGSIDPKEARVCKEAYEPALEAYQQGDFTSAIEGFLRAQSHEPLRSSTAQTPSAVLLARSREYLKNGEPSGWGGAHYSDL